MQKQRMEELSVRDLMSRYNLIVPEIQREYVWGNNDEIIMKFIDDIKDSYQDDKNNFITSLSILKEDIDQITTDSEIENAYNRFNANRFLNIGFLYSYRPNYFFGEGYQEDAFLIDGQQRFTTLFLLLYYFSITGEKRKEFIELFKVNVSNEQISFDYRVRNLTHDFVIELVKNCDDIEDIEYNTWFLCDFNSDDTIKSMIRTLKKIANEFPKPIESDDIQIHSDYFDFISNNIKFWHFKTEATSQGEELYITMNSRGEKLSDPEILKASLFEKVTDKFQWGVEWEVWQDFFWNNKISKDVNADKCFNEFLQCIKGFHSFQTKNGIKTQYDINYIKAHFTSLFRMVNDKTEFEWFKQCKSEILKIINLDFIGNEKKETDWFVPGDENKGIDNSRMVFVWSILEYLKGSDKCIQLSNKDIRVIRLFWVRYNNYDRSITKIQNKIEALKAEDGFLRINDSLSEDERAKHNYYINKLGLTDMDDFHEYELLIWKIEDHPLNINGRDYKAINISHLVDLEQNVTKEYLEKVNSKFVELFPLDILKPTNDLKTLLLYYSTDDQVFWNRDTPWYYENYDCSDWRRTIRRYEFKKIFEQYLMDKKVEVLLDESQRIFFIDKSVEDLRNLESRRTHIIVYSNLVANIWEIGNIAFYGEIEENTTRIFKNEIKIYKSARYYNSSSELWNEVSEQLNPKITIDVLLQNLIDKWKNYKLPDVAPSLPLF